MRRAILLSLIPLVLCAAAAGWFLFGDSLPPKVVGISSPARNLLFVVIDTLRTDAVGFQGNQQGTTPHMDRFTEGATVFENAWVQGTYTRASFLSYMSSKYVRAIGWDFVVPGENPPRGALCERDDLVLLPEFLGTRGFKNTAVVGNTFLFPKHGFPRGFDLWNRIDVPKMVGQTLPRWGMKKLQDYDVLALSKKEIEGWDPSQRNFLYSHFMYPHLPHKPSKAARSKFKIPEGLSGIKTEDCQRAAEFGTAEEKALFHQFYLSSVWSMDKIMGNLFEVLELTGHLDDTLVIITADHGEKIFEHRNMDHNSGVYEQLAHVPLVVRSPGLAAGRISRPVELVDLAPTVARMLGLDNLPAGWVGEDLFDDNGSTFTVTERLGETSVTDDGRYKAILDKTGTWRLYDLRVDPTEQSPVENQDKLKSLIRSHTLWMRRIPKGRLIAPKTRSGICSAENPEGSSTELMESLKSLGYVVDN